MNPNEIRFTKVATIDVSRLTPKLQKKLKEIIENNIVIDPFSGKKLVGDL